MRQVVPKQGEKRQMTKGTQGFTVPAHARVGESNARRCQNFAYGCLITNVSRCPRDENGNRTCAVFKDEDQRNWQKEQACRPRSDQPFEDLQLRVARARG